MNNKIVVLIILNIAVLLLGVQKQKENGQLSKYSGNALLYQALTGRSEPIIGGRGSCGSEECLMELYIHKKAITSKSCGGKYVHENAGIYPVSSEGFQNFTKIWANVFKSLDDNDILFHYNCGKFDHLIFSHLSPNTPVTEAAIIKADQLALLDKPWTHGLSNKTILVIHPLENSIKCQVKVLHDLFKESEGGGYGKGDVHNLWVGSDTKIKVAKMILANGNNNPHRSFTETLQIMQERIDNAGHFDVAIIGAGGYGMPLAHYCKNIKKKSAIVMGGVSQLLFGIKGKRWENNRYYEMLKKIRTRNWIWPLRSDYNAKVMEVRGDFQNYMGSQEEADNTCPH
jgi:hypothetical protein